MGLECYSSVCVRDRDRERNVRDHALLNAVFRNALSGILALSLSEYI